MRHPLLALVTLLLSCSTAWAQPQEGSYRFSPVNQFDINLTAA